MHRNPARSSDSDRSPARHTRAARCLLSATALDDAPASRVSGGLANHFAFRTTDYYAGLIDWNDPSDPIRKLIVPSPDETHEFGSVDASNEAVNTVVAGLQHKYPDTALLLVTDQCAGFCRYCFRKRLFTRQNRETLRDLRPALEYIRAHTEITDVLLSGGDPLTLPTSSLRKIVENILLIPHVRTIRIGSKIPAFDPMRIVDDPDLARLVADVVAAGRSLYVMTHFDHPRELTGSAREAIAILRGAGAMCLNQCPVTAGVNDDPAVLAALFQACTDIGCPQYYIFQCRPVTGNASFVIPLARAFEMVEDARGRVSGLSRRARFCLSHESGKVEIVGMDENAIYARYHRAKHADDTGRVVVFRRDESAYWIDQLTPVRRAR